ncbi:MAG: hypothetical protein ACTSQY_08215 [Candidatus Odinarchaeia archaeon]
MWFNNESDKIIQQWLDTAQYEREVFRTSQAEEGQAFYDNSITNKLLSGRYYPKSRFSGADLIALPITKEVINRIMGAFRTDISGATDATIEQLYKKYHIEKMFNNAVRNSLVLGSTSL